jgi:uncharacterized protein with FMN-binding domain
MRRAVITLTGTVAGLAALLSFKTHSAAIADAAPVAPTVTSQSSSAPAATAVASKTPVAGTKKSPTAGTSATASTSPAASQAASPKASVAAQSARVITGSVANTQYGPMQVQLTVTGTTITKATAVQQTDDGAESMQIDSFAIPQLNKETITAQSAKIDAVSGASYTSMGYIQSLQSAVDQIG